MRGTKGISTFALASICSLVLASTALATPITGSDTVGASVTSSNAASGNLGSATSFGLGSASQSFTGAGVGSFSVILSGTTVPLSNAAFNLANLASFGFTSPTVGTFTPAKITTYNKTATTLDVFLTGDFSPGSLFPSGSTAPSGASETLLFSQAIGGPITLTGTFAAPPAPNPVPEPLPIGLIGVGLAGMTILRRRRKIFEPA